MSGNFSQYGSASSKSRALPRITKDDTVISVLGVTGSGKSTFIQNLTDEKVEISHALESCTSQVGVYRCVLPGGRKIFLVDTPGFDDTYRSDTEVLQEVANWLVSAYEQQIQLTGVIYLHPINAPRVGGTALKNLRMFKKLCGQNALRSVALVTTMWSVADRQLAPQRERELATSDGFWKEMIDSGSKTFRQGSGPEAGKRSAYEIVDYLVRKNRKVVMDMQREMVDEKRTLDQTSAGQEMQRELALMRQKHERELAKLREDMKAALATKDLEHQQEVQEIKREMKAKLQEMQKNEADMQSLKVNRAGLQQQVDAQANREVAEWTRKIEKANRRLDEMSYQLQSQDKLHAQEMEIMMLRHKLNLKEEKVAWVRSQRSSSCNVM